MSLEDTWQFDVTHQKWNISVYVSRDVHRSLSGYIYPDHITCSKQDIEAHVESLYKANLEHGLLIWCDNTVKGTDQPARVRKKIGGEIIGSSVTSFSSVEVK
jgi:hypothetical protein